MRLETPRTASWRTPIRSFLTRANHARRRAAFRTTELGFQLRKLLGPEEGSDNLSVRPRNLYAPPLPAFLIIGAQKAGTTSLYSHLLDHPFVLSACHKEIHFFNRSFHRGMDWYRSNFPAARDARCVTGEATPGYLWHPHVPQRVHEALPAAKLIAMLRNPVDRAFSQYQHDVRRWRSCPPFVEAIEQEAEALSHEIDRMFADPMYAGDSLKRQGYLHRGIYVLQLRRWRRYFPSEQMLILKSEDFFLDPAACVSRVFEFLGLPVVLPEGYKAFNAGGYVPLDASLRDRLAGYFEPYNQMLYEDLGVDFGWEADRIR